MVREFGILFRVAGSNDDVNMLNQSSLITNVLKYEAPNVNFAVNGHEYHQGYYLADGTYPQWLVVVKTIPLS
jgi:hypothetical protein